MTQGEHSPPTTVLPAATLNRRLEVDRKQLKVAQLLQDTQCEGLLLLEPANYRWLTGGSTPRGLLHRDEMPVLYLSPQNRWLYCSNVDSQRLFDEELDLLGFQLKEVHWTLSREAALADLAAARRLACDREWRGCTHVGPYLEQERRRLSSHEAHLLGQLGKVLAHALEATLRGTHPGDTEEEVAGQLAHRLWKHGAAPHAIQIIADGRGGAYRRGDVKPRPVLRDLQLQATAEQYGLFATASRTMSFSTPEEAFRRDFEAATRAVTLSAAALKPGGLYSQAVRVARDFPAHAGLLAEWRSAPPGYVTGREPAESLLSLTCTERFTENTPVVWQSRIGLAGVCDTMLYTPDGWRTVTEVESWPVRTIVIDGTAWRRPEVLVRK